jgi:sugar fermentation stimulation protein A
VSVTRGIVVPHGKPLVTGTFVRRFKRFFAEVDLSGERVLAHCPNTGRMEGMLQPGARVHLLCESNPRRKLAYTWELVELDGVVLGANPARANQLVRAALLARQLPGLKRFSELRSEKSYGDSRADFWLRIGRRNAFVEVKNVHLVYPDGRAYFPDAPSARALRHLRELEDVAKRGDLAAVVFVVQRSGARSVRPSDVHDPDFAEGARHAKRAGVRFYALEVLPSIHGYTIESRLPVDLAPYSLAVIRSWADTRACGAPVLSR